MEKLSNIKEVVSYLQEGELVTSNGKDQFIMKNKKIYHYGDGSHYGLDLEDFVELYKKIRIFDKFSNRVIYNNFL